MKYASSLKRRSKGFTLIELLVVIAIIGTLSAIVLSAINGARVRSRDASRLAQIKQIKTALELFYSENGYYPNCWDSGYSGGCDYVNFNGPGSQADTTRDNNFMRFLSPYLKGAISDPINSSTNFYIYATQAEYPTGSGRMYSYLLGIFLEDTSNPALRNSISYGDPNGFIGTYVIGP